VCLELLGENRMKKTIILFFVAVFCRISPSVSAEPVVTLLFEGGRVHAAVPLPEDVFKAAPVEGTDGNLYWLSVEAGAGAEYGIEDGVYVFDSPGVFFLRHLGARCDDLVISPDGKVAALAEDSETVRWWRFYAWADMESLGRVACPVADAKLFWAAEDVGVVYTVLESGDYGRAGDEPRAPRSVAYYDFAQKTERVLLRGVSRYDYRAIGLEGLAVQAEKSTAAGAEPLPGLPAPFMERVSATLPQAGCPELPLHYDLAVEGRYLGMNEGDGILAIIEMLPSTHGEPLELALSVQDSGIFAAFMAIPAESRVRVTYDMVQQWDARAGECVVTPVARTVAPTPDRDPRG